MRMSLCDLQKLEAASRGSSRDRAVPRDFEEALAAELFAAEEGAAPKEKAKTEDMVGGAEGRRVPSRKGFGRRALWAGKGF